MAMSFIRKKGKGIFYDNYTEIFDQVNTAAEASTAVHRKEWKTSKSLPVRALRLIYLQLKYVKFNFDLLFMRS